MSPVSPVLWSPQDYNIDCSKLEITAATSRSYVEKAVALFEEDPNPGGRKSEDTYNREDGWKVCWSSQQIQLTGNSPNTPKLASIVLQIALTVLNHTNLKAAPPSIIIKFC